MYIFECLHRSYLGDAIIKVDSHFTDRQVYNLHVQYIFSRERIRVEICDSSISDNGYNVDGLRTDKNIVIHDILSGGAGTCLG